VGVPAAGVVVVGMMVAMRVPAMGMRVLVHGRRAEVEIVASAPGQKPYAGRLGLVKLRAGWRIETLAAPRSRP
jgi:hypothetical protein